MIEISTWVLDEEFPVFPVGSKPKRLLICPNPASDPFLISGHRYLFKVAHGWQAHQMWSEVIAYELARPLALPVPPCFVAKDSKTGEVGVLVEFFYGYPNDPTPPRFVHGSDIIQGLLPEGVYDQKTGRPHTVRRNLAICRALRMEEPAAWWARAFVFDAIIGNTDRHPENWGCFFRRLQEPARLEREMAPLFDNGTSLGYEQPNEAVGTQWSRRRLEKYIDRGSHHCSWLDTETKGMKHIELCARYCESYPTAGAIMKKVIPLTDSDIDGVLEWCTKFAISLPFTAERATFTSALTKARRDLLAHSLGA